MKRRLSKILLCLGLAVLPQYARADAGTPLIRAGLLHLVFGNMLIGLGEGLLLAWLFAIPKRKGILVMIPANYASSWLGGLFIRAKIIEALPMDLNNGWKWFWVMVLITYLMTLIIEWPFVAWCFRGSRDWWEQSLRASLVVQSASYVLIFGWYWLASGTSLYTQMNIVPPEKISLPGSVLVYFIGPTDGNVYKRELNSNRDEKIFELHSKGVYDRLFCQPNAFETNHWDLVARLETEEFNHPNLVNILTNMAIEAAPVWRNTQIAPRNLSGTWFNFGELYCLGDATNSPWKFSAGFWPVEGLRGANRITAYRVEFSYETPFGQWVVRNAVHVPTDKVLFQLGNDQICAFDPENQKVALLWHGRGPVPVMNKSRKIF